MIFKVVITGIFFIGLLSGCGGGSGSNRDAMGTLSVALTDASVDMVDQVRLYVTGVTVKPQGGPPVFYESELTDCAAVAGETDDCNPVDLLSLQDGNLLTVFADQEMAAGRYQWLRLDVNETMSYIVEETGGIDNIEVRIPSEQGLQLSGGFVILAGQSTDLVMDWDARKGLANPLGQDGYLLKPSIRVIDMSEYGTLSGSVDVCVDTAVVCVFEGDLIPVPSTDPAESLDDIDNNEPNPLVTAGVTQADDASFGYEVKFLSVGTYTVALTCDVDEVPVSDTDLTDGNDDLTFVSPQIADVQDGQTETINF